jgi:hypothetical protein
MYNPSYGADHIAELLVKVMLNIYNQPINL